MKLASTHGRLSLISDHEAFPRFVDLVLPLVGSADVVLQAAIDEVLTAAAATHYEAARAFAAQHARRCALPKPKPRPLPRPAPAAVVAPTPITPPPPPAPVAVAKAQVKVKKATPTRKLAAKPAAKKPAAKSKAKSKPKARAN